ncbi:hypothetical protein [Yersinia ruckeri]|uniref:hypothetical protein n=1 Tax=Yersinia ruckeri TaxID=29486 RepID=UPI0004E3C14A|nr:hypothetical protein QMA0440_02651 [Yersinia ruckeri]KFE38389.1 hypothetical protein nADLYRO1b_2197 [Yersinia ruckeri]
MYYSDNAHYMTGSLETLVIKNIQINGYSMTYRYKWSIFNVGIDINTEDFITNTVTFIIHPEKIIFDIIDYDKPSTADKL